MKRTALLIALSATVLFGCKNGEKKEVSSEEMVETIETEGSAVIDDHNSQNSLDWAGIYEGTVPCADCKGIKTVLELNEDKTYVLSQTYLGNPEKDNENKRIGNFTWDDSGSKVTLEDGDDEMQYKVGENQLLMLNTEGNMIDGKISDLYILKKTSF